MIMEGSAPLESSMLSETPRQKERYDKLMEGKGTAFSFDPDKMAEQERGKLRIKQKSIVLYLNTIPEENRDTFQVKE